MMKKLHHSTSTVVTVLLIGGMFITCRHESIWTATTTDLQQPTPPLFTDQTMQGWMTTFDLENCDFVSSGENDYFVLKPGYQAILGGQEDGEELE